MKIGVLKERLPDEKRVAISPEMVKKYRNIGMEIYIEKDAGTLSLFSDIAFKEAGANIVSSMQDVVDSSDIILTINVPEYHQLKAVSQKIIVGLFDPYSQKDNIQHYTDLGISLFALNLIPRISRAQSMDVLSSQANLAGYKAVIDAAALYGRAFPLMMTAAGTVPAARVLVMGVGVAGLQAIATARRLGAVVSATDVRPSTKEQVESLGAKFIAVEDEEFIQAQNESGYAKPMSDAYHAKQAELIKNTIAKQDIVITTAQIPGKKAPILVTHEMIETMRTGSILFDMATEQGGNIEGSMAGQVKNYQGVHIIGYKNIPSRLAFDASQLFARNLFHFVSLLKKEDAITIDLEDEIIKSSLLVHNQESIHTIFSNSQEE